MSTEKIAKVVSAKVINPIDSFLVLEAHGQVLTTGYTHPKLEPHVYFIPPADGIYEFDFVITPPTGIVGDVVLPKVAFYEWEKPQGFKGAKVYGENNNVVTRL